MGETISPAYKVVCSAGASRLDENLPLIIADDLYFDMYHHHFKLLFMVSVTQPNPVSLFLHRQHLILKIMAVLVCRCSSLFVAAQTNSSDYDLTTAYYNYDGSLIVTSFQCKNQSDQKKVYYVNDAIVSVSTNGTHFTNLYQYGFSSNAPTNYTSFPQTKNYTYPQYRHRNLSKSLAWPILHREQLSFWHSTLPAKSLSKH